jgi:hypothetical protein
LAGIFQVGQISPDDLFIIHAVTVVTSASLLIASRLSHLAPMRGRVVT